MAGFINIFFYSTVAGLSTVVGVYLVRRFSDWTRRNSTYVISFAVGVIMANAFFNLLPEAIELNARWFFYGFAGFLTLYLIELAMNLHYCEDEHCEVRSAGTVSSIGIGLHSLLDGFTIGVGFEVGLEVGLVTAFAVIFHELPEGVFTYTLLRHDEVPEERALLYSWMVALATPVGAVATYWLVQGVTKEALGALLAVAGGTFIYVGASDLVPETHRRSNYRNALLVVGGTVFVLFLSWLVR